MTITEQSNCFRRSPRADRNLGFDVSTNFSAPIPALDALAETIAMHKISFHISRSSFKQVAIRALFPAWIFMRSVPVSLHIRPQKNRSRSARVASEARQHPRWTGSRTKAGVWLGGESYSGSCDFEARYAQVDKLVTMFILFFLQPCAVKSEFGEGPRPNSSGK